MIVIKIPKKYKKIIDDLNKEYDMAYLDSLAFIIFWRKNNNIKSRHPIHNLRDPWDSRWDTHSFSQEEILFRKLVATLIENFYEKYTPPADRKRLYIDLGFEFADWLLKTPIEYFPDIPHHTEIYLPNYDIEAPKTPLKPSKVP